MVNRDGFLNLLHSEISDLDRDIRFCDEEINYHKIRKAEKGVKFKEKRLHKNYISYLKKRKNIDKKHKKTLHLLAAKAARLEANL